MIYTLVLCTTYVRAGKCKLREVCPIISSLCNQAVRASCLRFLKSRGGVFVAAFEPSMEVTDLLYLMGFLFCFTWVHRCTASKHYYYIDTKYTVMVWGGPFDFRTIFFRMRLSPIVQRGPFLDSGLPPPLSLHSRRHQITTVLLVLLIFRTRMSHSLYFVIGESCEACI